MTERLDISSATGVDLQLNIAGLGARSYAFVVDFLIRSLLAVAWYAISLNILLEVLDLRGEEPAVLIDRMGTQLFLVSIPTAVIFFLYHPILEIAMRGRTPGKRIAGIRVVAEDGTEPGALALAIRNVLRLLDSLPFAYTVGLVSVFSTRRAVRIGDLAAGTVLVYDQGPLGRKSGSQANTNAALRLGLAEAELVQDLSERWDELGTEERNKLARGLLAQLEPDDIAAYTDWSLRGHLRRLLENP